LIARSSVVPVQHLGFSRGARLSIAPRAVGCRPWLARRVRLVRQQGAQDDEIGTVRAPMVFHPDRLEAEREQQTEHPGVVRKYCALDAAKAL